MTIDPLLPAFASELVKISAERSRAREYVSHAALNLGQAVRDVRYFHDHPDADKVAPKKSAKHLAASVTARIPSLASNLYYAALPPQLHHTKEELKDLTDSASAKEWFLHGYKPWEYHIPGDSEEQKEEWKKLKTSADTQHVNHTIIHSEVHSKDHDYLVGQSEFEGKLHILHAFAGPDFKEKGPAASATLQLVDMPKDSPKAGKVWMVTSMHVRPDSRGKGLGKDLWKKAREIHPGSTFFVKPDPFKDKNMTAEQLTEVYKSYGFVPEEKGLLANHPGTVKTAGFAPKKRADAFHEAKVKDWPGFENDLRNKTFQKAMLKHEATDTKLGKYVKNYGGQLSSKTIIAIAPSRTDKDKEYKIKVLPTGRLACECKDWQYHHSVRKTDCDHIKAVRHFYKAGLVKMSSALSTIVKGMNLKRRVDMTQDVRERGRRASQQLQS